MPNGSYFLQLDSTYDLVTSSELIEMTADTPDLSLISAARPDLARVTRPTPVTLDFTNLQPWQTGNLLLISSSQGDVYERPTLMPRPTEGATSYTGMFDWSQRSTSLNIPGLPDASRNDVVFFNQRSTLRIEEGDNAAELRYASRYVRLTDFTVSDGVPSTLMASLIETPMTGRLRANVRGSEFAALAPEVHPSARPTQGKFGNLGFSVQAVPHSVQYPNTPASSSSSLFYFQSLTPTASNFDYGTFEYPQFHDPIWAEWRLAAYYFDVTLLVPGTNDPVELSYASVYSLVPMTPAPRDPIAPILGPPTAPLINGEDAFSPHSGVGVQPVLSWSPPDLGTATSYVVSIINLDRPEEAERIPRATVYSGRSFKVPLGFLRPGRLYWGLITATQADYDVLDRPPFREGTPYYQSDCMIGIFTP